MNNDLIEKVNYILSKFYENKTPKIWKMDTDIYSMLDRLGENIKNISDPIKEIIIKKEENKNTKERFNLYFHNNKNNIIITPNFNEESVGKNTANQYLKVLKAIGIVLNYDKFQCNVVIRCVWLKEQIEDLKTIAQKIIINSLEKVNYNKDLGYSIFLFLLIYKNDEFDLKNIKPEYSNINLKRKTKDDKINNCEISKIRNSWNNPEIKNGKEVKNGYKNTYEQLIEKNFENYKLEEIINDIYENIKININEFYSSDYEDVDISNNFKIKSEYELKIIRERQKFKDNIFNDRKEKCIINANNKDYYDLELFNEKNSLGDLKFIFNKLEACHIYEVKNIKFNKDNIDYISDPNNGLMMSPNYHKAFDNGSLIFDEEGDGFLNESMYNQNFKKNIYVKKCKIRKEVFNNEMKSFFTKRNYYKFEKK